MESDKQKSDKNTIVFSFSCHKEEDIDIITWINELSKGDKSYILREAIRFYINRDKPSPLTLNDLMDEIQEIKSKFEQGFIIKDSENKETSEPIEAAKNLDNLLGRLKSGEFG